MRRGVPHGYTIVEVMIFLAVTGLLFVFIAITFTGQRGRTQFQTAAREIESRVQDIVNDVSTGFYPKVGGFQCTRSAVSPYVPVITAGSAPQGTNTDCIFLGRVIQFRVANNGERYAVYSLVGLREVSGEDTENYNDAQPTASTLLREELALPGGMSVAYVRNNSTGLNINATGFLSSLGPSVAGVVQESGSLSVSLLAVPGGGPTWLNSVDMVNHINANVNQAYVTANQNPANGITVCFNSGTSDQHAILNMGASGGRLATDLTIGSGVCT